MNLFWVNRYSTYINYYTFIRKKVNYMAKILKKFINLYIVTKYEKTNQKFKFRLVFVRIN